MVLSFAGPYQTEFQSLIHQGKIARLSEAQYITYRGIKFQSLIHQGKIAREMAEALQVGQAVNWMFQSLIHQGKIARTSMWRLTYRRPC